MLKNSLKNLVQDFEIFADHTVREFYFSHSGSVHEFPRSELVREFRNFVEPGPVQDFQNFILPLSSLGRAWISQFFWFRPWIGFGSWIAAWKIFSLE